MAIRRPFALFALLFFASAVSALQAPPAPADLAWARKMLHRRRLDRRAGPSAVVQPTGTVIKSIYNDCPPYGDATFSYATRYIYPNPESEGLGADSCSSRLALGVADGVQTLSATTTARTILRMTSRLLRNAPTAPTAT